MIALDLAIKGIFSAMDFFDPIVPHLVPFSVPNTQIDFNNQSPLPFTHKPNDFFIHPNQNIHTTAPPSVSFRSDTFSFGEGLINGSDGLINGSVALNNGSEGLNKVSLQIPSTEKGQPRLSFADTVRGRSSADAHCLPKPLMKGGFPSIRIGKSLHQRGLDYCKFALVGRMDLNKVKADRVREAAVGLWKLKGTCKITPLGRGFFMIRLDNEADFHKVIATYTWFLDGFPMRIQKWTPGFNPDSICQSTANVWVRFPGLRQQFWDNEIILSMANAIGTPLSVDPNTKERNFGFYAAVLVEVDMAKNLPNKIEVVIEDEGNFFQNVEYYKLPKYCSFCRFVGHSPVECRSKQAECGKAIEKQNAENLDTSVGAGCSISVAAGISPLSRTSRENVIVDAANGTDVGISAAGNNARPLSMAAPNFVEASMAPVVNELREVATATGNVEASAVTRPSIADPLLALQAVVGIAATAPSSSLTSSLDDPTPSNGTVSLAEAPMDCILAEAPMDCTPLAISLAEAPMDCVISPLAISRTEAGPSVVSDTLPSFHGRPPTLHGEAEHLTVSADETGMLNTRAPLPSFFACPDESSQEGKGEEGDAYYYNAADNRVTTSEFVINKCTENGVGSCHHMGGKVSGAASFDPQVEAGSVAPRDGGLINSTEVSPFVGFHGSNATTGTSILVDSLVPVNDTLVPDGNRLVVKAYVDLAGKVTSDNSPLTTITGNTRTTNFGKDPIDLRLACQPVNGAGGGRSWKVSSKLFRDKRKKVSSFRLDKELREISIFNRWEDLADMEESDVSDFSDDYLVDPIVETSKKPKGSNVVTRQQARQQQL